MDMDGARMIRNGYRWHSLGFWMLDDGLHNGIGEIEADLVYIYDCAVCRTILSS